MEEGGDRSSFIKDVKIIDGKAEKFLGKNAPQSLILKVGRIFIKWKAFCFPIGSYVKIICFPSTADAWIDCMPYCCKF